MDQGPYYHDNNDLTKNACAFIVQQKLEWVVLYFIK